MTAEEIVLALAAFPDSELYHEGGACIFCTATHDGSRRTSPHDANCPYGMAREWAGDPPK